jgi:hypothetical protein
LDRKKRHRLKQVLIRSGGAGVGGHKRARTEAELRAEMEKTKRGNSTYHVRYDRGMTEEQLQELR